MSNTPSHRFHVTCETCGFLDGCQSMVEAKVRSTSAHDGRHKDCGLIEIYDSMAQIGRPELYSYNGVPSAIRRS